MVEVGIHVYVQDWTRPINRKGGLKVSNTSTLLNGDTTARMLNKKTMLEELSGSDGISLKKGPDLKCRLPIHSTDDPLSVSSTLYLVSFHVLCISTWQSTECNPKLSWILCQFCFFLFLPLILVILYFTWIIIFFRFFCLAGERSPCVRVASNVGPLLSRFVQNVKRCWMVSHHVCFEHS